MMTQEMKQLAYQNLEERLLILQDMYHLMFNPEPTADTKEQQQLEMWID